MNPREFLATQGLFPGDRAFAAFERMIEAAYIQGVENARIELRVGLGRRDPTLVCPTCLRPAKRHPRTQGAKNTLWLIMLTHLSPLYENGWVHVDVIHANLETKYPETPFPKGSADFCKWKHWGLIEERHTGRRDGIWRPTQSGTDFVNREVTCQRTAHLYADHADYFSGPEIHIDDLLGNFNYAEAMQFEEEMAVEA